MPYFGVGNESWGCGGQMRPEYAADLHRRYASFLHTTTVRVASGDGEGRDEVTDVMLARAKDQMDAISLHHDTVVGPWEAKGRATGFDTTAWAKALHDAAVGLDQHVAHRRHHGPPRPRRPHRAVRGRMGPMARQENTLRDALVAALAFHTYAFDLYQPFKGATPWQAQLQAPRLPLGGLDLTSLDASVARGADGGIWIALVNLDPQQPARVATNLDGGVQGRLLAAPAMDSHNSFERPEAVVPRPYAAQASGGRLVPDLPPRSIVVVQVSRR